RYRLAKKTTAGATALVRSTSPRRIPCPTSRFSLTASCGCVPVSTGIEPRLDAPARVPPACAVRRQRPGDDGESMSLRACDIVGPEASVTRQRVLGHEGTL